MLSRLADGGMRDALSLLDQCAGGKAVVDEQAILNTLGLAGNVEIAALIGQLAARDTAVALDTLARLYEGGKDVGAILGELSSLARDLLLRKTAPRGGAALMAGGYDEATLRSLGEQFSAQRLLYMLTQIQTAAANLSRSANRRTDAELCLIRLSDEELDESFSGLSARIARLEERMSQGISIAPPPPEPRRVRAVPSPCTSARTEDTPPWEEEHPPLPEAPPGKPEYISDEPKRAESRDAAPPTPASPSGGDSTFWPSFAADLRGKVPPTVIPYLNNPAKVTGVWKNGKLTLWVDSEFTRSMLNKPAVLEKLAQAAAASFGGTPQVGVVTGTPPLADPAKPPVPAAERDPLDDLMSFGGLDNITIQ